MYILISFHFTTIYNFNKNSDNNLLKIFLYLSFMNNVSASLIYSYRICVQINKESCRKTRKMNISSWAQIIYFISKIFYFFFVIKDEDEKKHFDFYWFCIISFRWELMEFHKNKLSTRFVCFFLLRDTKWI